MFCGEDQFLLIAARLVEHKFLLVIMATDIIKV